MAVFKLASIGEIAPPVRRAIQSLKEYVDNQDQYRVCTSTTRPTGVKGLSIYETDTNRQLTHDGTGWVIMSEPTQSYTPSLSGITLGNGTMSAQFHRSDGWCDLSFRLDTGSTTAVGGSQLIGLPVAYFNGNEFEAATAMLFNPGGRFYAYLYAASFTQVGLQASRTDQTYAFGWTPTATIPFTWGAGCAILFSVRYRMTTRYS